MPFCPKCRYEYNTGTSICPDCDEPLVDRLPDKSESDPNNTLADYDNWVCIGRLTSSIYANMINEVFREKEIPVVVLSGTGHFGQTGQMGASSFRPIDGAYSILVPEEYVEDADQEAEIILGEDWTKFRVQN